MAEELIRVENLKKHFKTKYGLLYAVDGIDFSIEKGKTLGLVGESGCGKSTTGRLIMRLIDSTGGKIIFEEQDITHIKGNEMHELRREIQMIFQDPFGSLNPRKSVYELINEPLRWYNVCKSKAEEKEKIESLMETVGLAQRFINTYPHELDGGRRQRIGVARARALDPKLIVCDEPVSALMFQYRRKSLTYSKICNRRED